MRLEQFKNTLIPVDYVMYAEYIPKEDDSSEFTNVTLVHVLIPNTFVLTPIPIKGNELKEFQTWLSKLQVNEAKSSVD